MSASLGLFRLQQIDRQIDRAQIQLESIQKSLENDQELKSALRLAEEKQTNQKQAMQVLKNTEHEVQALKIKIERVNSNLYGGSVKNPKELQDLQKEIVSLKKHLETLEEKQLEAMINADSAENEAQNAAADLETLQFRRGSEHSRLLGERSAYQKQIEQLNEEKKAALNPIETSQRQAYEELRRLKRGVAVAEIIDHSCEACGTTINASIQQTARSQKQLVNCPSCGRILFTN